MTRHYIISCLRASVIAALLATAGATAPLGQGRPADQTPTFRSRTDLVQLDVSALDSKGLPVRGLTVEDFTILEDGVPQPVVAFAAVDVPTWSPAAAAWTREVGPDVVSNRLDAQRAVVIVLDDFNTRRDPGITEVAKSVGLAAIDQLGPADLAAVVYVVNRANGQEFTLDRARLRAAVERFVPSGLSPAPDTRFTASTPTGGLAVPSRIDGPSGACLRNCIVMALKNIGDIFAPWPGARKTVVLISPAEVASDVEDYISQSDERGLMFAALQQANVNVYQLDPHGLVAGPKLLDKFGTFAENTGGRAVVNTNAPAEFVPQIFRENSSYYLLGFRPANSSRDGRFHKTKVQVLRPGVHVRTRAGYYAATDRPQTTSQRQMSAVDRALSSGLPTGDLPISLMLFPFATTDKAGAALAVVARLERDAGIAPGTVVDLTALAFNDKWKEVASVTQRFMLPPASDRTPQSEAATRLNLPPGRYEIRTAVKVTNDDRTGSVYGSITIPNFAGDPLSLSGIALEGQSGGAAMNDDLTALVPAGLTTIRVFSKSERVAAATRVYQRRGKSPGPVRVIARIVDAENRAALTTETTLDPSAFAAHQADYRLELPLDRLVAGEYLLTLDASTSTTSTRRDLRFSVRD